MLRDFIVLFFVERAEGGEISVGALADEWVRFFREMPEKEDEERYYLATGRPKRFLIVAEAFESLRRLQSLGLIHESNVTDLECFRTRGIGVTPRFAITESGRDEIRRWSPMLSWLRSPRPA